MFDPESIISVADLSIERAKNFARYVSSSSNVGFELGRCHRVEGMEVVAVVAHPQVPQRPANDIRYDEPLAVVFGANADDLPQVLSMREDFPQVPHLNLSRSEFPKSLCLFEERREDLNLRWTPALLGERILWWLRETAYGRLHQKDQSLEPFIAGVNRPLILPPDIFAESSSDEMLLVYSANAGDKEILVAERAKSMVEGRPGQPFVLFPFRLPAQEHGVIRSEPTTLRDLDRLFQQVGRDFIATLRMRLQEKAGQLPSNALGTILVVVIPKVRQLGNEVESTDVLGFRCRVNKGRFADVGPGELGEILGVLGREQTVIAKGQRPLHMLLTPLEEVREKAENVGVSLLTPEFKLTLKRAAILSGHNSRFQKPILAVGMGALGSQVFENLARQGFGQWTLVDSDYFAPHNAVRHSIFGNRFGLGKANEMSSQANQMFEDVPMAQGIVADVLSSGSKAEIEKCADDAELILDMSASVPVARHLALDIPVKAKRASLFLSPSGLDLVAMTEDSTRTISLDVIELQYLRALLEDKELEGHLSGGTGQSRYGGCRDITSHISQELVALHAAIGAKAVREIAASFDARLSVWRCNSEEMTVCRVEVALAKPVSHIVDDWTIIFDEALSKKLIEFRSKHLPKETCGILLGYLDMQRKRVYVCQVLAAPEDSIQETCGCERGVEGMSESLAHANTTTKNQVTYIGEWHSHPDNAPCRESEQDKKQMTWLTEKLHPEGRPALMLIVCQNDQIWPYLVSPLST